jgi:multiple sugar transport system substrate-binding protein
MERKKMTGEWSRKTFRTRLEVMVNELREDIITGRYRSGDFLPSERDFAVQYDLSNKSVRKGLDILVTERLIEKIPRVGNKIVRPEDIGTLTLKFGFYENMWRMVDMELLLAEFHKCYPNIRVHDPVIHLSGSFYLIWTFTFDPSNNASLLLSVKGDKKKKKEEEETA